MTASVVQRGAKIKITSKARRPDSRPDRRIVRVPLVGAGLLAMVVNDDVGYLALCGALTDAIAGKPAPTGRQLCFCC
ncbi:hypothetical protein FIV38_23780 [Pseudomonas proteolytica]|nr:hypothetical protein F4W61_11825 [Pseudomonas proteolytica]TWR76203.1 hypothetical protein FIV38_23780 [Pseudomonas proteolytica]